MKSGLAMLMGIGVAIIVFAALQGAVLAIALSTLAVFLTYRMWRLEEKEKSIAIAGTLEDHE